MSANLVKTIDNVKLRSKDEAYRLLSKIGSSENKERLAYELKIRELEGNIKIAEQVLLPHIETEFVSESKVIILRLNEPIFWNENTGRVKILFTVFLKIEETEEIKQQINGYIRKLADDKYILQLLNEKDLSKII